MRTAIVIKSFNIEGLHVSHRKLTFKTEQFTGWKQDNIKTTPLHYFSRIAAVEVGWEQTSHSNPFDSRIQSTGLIQLQKIRQNKLTRRKVGGRGEGVLRENGGWSEVGCKANHFIIPRARANKYQRNCYTSFPASFSQDYYYHYYYYAA